MTQVTYCGKMLHISCKHVLILSQHILVTLAIPSLEEYMIPMQHPVNAKRGLRDPAASVTLTQMFTDSSRDSQPHLTALVHYWLNKGKEPGQRTEKEELAKNRYSSTAKMTPDVMSIESAYNPSKTLRDQKDMRQSDDVQVWLRSKYAGFLDLMNEAKNDQPTLLGKLALLDKLNTVGFHPYPVSKWLLLGKRNAYAGSVPSGIYLFVTDYSLKTCSIYIMSAHDRFPRHTVNPNTLWTVWKQAIHCKKW